MTYERSLANMSNILGKYYNRSRRKSQSLRLILIPKDGLIRYVGDHPLIRRLSWGKLVSRGGFGREKRATIEKAMAPKSG